MEKAENNTSGTSMANAFKKADIPFSPPDKAAKKEGETLSIINNKGSQKIIRPRKTDYLRFLNHVASKIETLRDYVNLTPEEEFDKDFRQRQGKPPIPMDTELRHRLHILYENVTSTMTLFEGGVPSVKDSSHIDSYLNGIKIESESVS